MTAPECIGQPRIEFWFEFGSTYSYLTTMRIEDRARTAGVALAWRRIPAR